MIHPSQYNVGLAYTFFYEDLVSGRLGLYQVSSRAGVCSPQPMKAIDDFQRMIRAVARMSSPAGKQVCRMRFQQWPVPACNVGGVQGCVAESHPG